MILRRGCEWRPGGRGPPEGWSREEGGVCVRCEIVKRALCYSEAP